jgi:tRNA(adenine34) deaminase
MCAGASSWVRIGKIVYGAKDIKKGYSMVKQKVFHPKTKVKKGVMASKCSGMLTQYFRKKR